MKIKVIYLFCSSVLKILNSFLSAIILILIFYLIVTPIGLILRLAGKDLLGLKNGNYNSYWVKKECASNKESYLKQF